jgi:hypothetical protein
MYSSIPTPSMTSMTDRSERDRGITGSSEMCVRIEAHDSLGHLPSQPPDVPSDRFRIPGRANGRRSLSVEMHCLVDVQTVPVG